MKRVYCLYRVSTVGQVDQNDIPMQRQACREFAREKGWKIVREFTEKGISGYKQSADQREALQELKRVAIQKQFDVLLVFMFDRLGRRDDETPFVVEWFVKNGIEVWSVVEGEQRFEDHIDKLLNYIRFWQSSGESLKTSIRTKARMEQLFQEHGFIGGTAPYGYKLCRLGRTNKKGYELYDILVDPTQEPVVREIYQQYCVNQMGTYRIAVGLNAAGHRTSRGALWTAASVHNVLQNPIYIGIRRYGGGYTDRFPHLQIIEDSLFQQAQNRLEKEKLPSFTPGYTKHRNFVLLPEEVYCMHCGKRLTVTQNTTTRRRKDGVKMTYRRLKYICINKSSLQPCNGQRSYSVSVIDTMVLKLMEEVLLSEKVMTVAQATAPFTARRERLQCEIRKEQASIETLKAEVVKTLQGTSSFGSVLICDLLQQSEAKLTTLEQELLDAEEELRACKAQQARFRELRKSLVASGEISLLNLSFQQQREIAHAIIHRVELGRGNAIHIQWNFGGAAHLPANAGE